MSDGWRIGLAFLVGATISMAICWPLVAFTVRRLSRGRR